MPNYILYYALSPDENFECAYSLLKYLDLYNLKPPATHSVVVYTHKPAMLEAYGSFFNSFELKEINTYDRSGQTATGDAEKKNDAKAILETYQGNILYLPPNAYPVKELEPLFSAMNAGAVYMGQSFSHADGLTDIQKLPVIGFNSQQQSVDFIFRSQLSKNIQGFVEQYEDLREFRKLLQDFFRRYQEESIPNQVKLMHSIDAREIQDQKNKFKQLPLYQRLIRKIMGKGWDISSHAQKI